MIASVGHNFIPLGTKAVYNVKDGKISLESEGLGLFLKPEVALPFYDFNNNGVSLRDIALKMTTGTIAVTVTNVEPTDTGNIIQIAYTLYMPEVKLPNSQSVELTMNVLYTIIQNRSEPPVSEAEKALNDNIEEMQRKFNQNIQIDWSAVGSFFIPTSQATAATFWGSLGAAFLTFAPFYYYYDYEEEIELAFE